MSSAPDPNRPDTRRPASWVGEVLGVSDRTIRELAAKGILERDGKGLYAIRASVRAYCAHIREIAARRADTGSGSSLTAERLRHTREKADQVELANARTRGELLPTAEVEAEWSRQCIALRARLLAVSSRCASRNGQLTPADLATIDREIRDALTELGTSPTENPLNAAQDACSGLDSP